MFWLCCGDFSSAVDAFKNRKKAFRNNEDKKKRIENDERFASIFTYNSEEHYSGNRYNNVFAKPTYREDDPLLYFLDKNSLRKCSDSYRSITDQMGEFVCTLLAAILLAVTFPFSLFFALKFIGPYQRVVVMRLGKCRSVCGQGMVLLLPFIDRATVIDLRVTSVELPTVNVFTSDKGIIELSAVVLVRVSDPLTVCCTVQNVKELLNSLVYTALHRHLGKRLANDITNPAALTKLINKCQADLEDFIQKYGIQIDRINISQVKILKQPENGAVSVFKTIMRSDVGQQMFGVLGSYLRDVVAEASAETSEAACEKKNEAGSSNKQQLMQDNNNHRQHSAEYNKNNNNNSNIPSSSFYDPELEIILQRVRLSLSQNALLLASKMGGKCFRVCCTDLGDVEFEIDLRAEGGWCGWTWQRVGGNSSLPPDVHFTLTKATILALVSGQLSPMGAYLNGLVQIRGPMQDAILLKHLADCC